jgi:hypothetical protein
LPYLKEGEVMDDIDFCCVSGNRKIPFQSLPLVSSIANKKGRKKKTENRSVFNDPMTGNWSEVITYDS